MTKQQSAERDSALAELRNHIHEGDTIYTIVRHRSASDRSASGMYQAIDVYTFSPVPGDESRFPRVLDEVRIGGVLHSCRIDIVKLRWSWSVATALGYRYDKKHEAIGICGCGFDQAGQIVRDLAHALFGDCRKLRKEEI